MKATSAVRRDEPPAAGLPDIRAPLTSLISKSEKALTKVSPLTWQHDSLLASLEALRLAMHLMEPERDRPSSHSGKALQDALCALSSMMRKTEKAQQKFPSGTAQHTLLANRLAALQAAEAAIRRELAS